MRGLRWLGALALALLVAVPSAEPQNIIAGQPADGRTHAFNLSEVGRINPGPYLNPHAPAPQRPTVTP